MANTSMPETEITDLHVPFEVDKLLEVRTARMKRMPGLKTPTAIDKTICPEPMKVGKLGLEGDEHDLTFHGGPDKAILGYCSTHYQRWRQEHPERADRFVPGGFGENFVTSRMNERNVCIGDMISVGQQVLLQVSLPRMPCFKLNYRFSLDNFASSVYEKSRTGWYYRVLREGTVKAGDELKLVDRRWPQWTVERVQEYLHRDTDNLEMNELLAGLEALGEESKGQFRRRVAKAKRGSRPSKEVPWRAFRVVERKMETARIASFKLKAVVQEENLDNPLVGAHARIKLPNGLSRTYSVVSGDDYSQSANNMLELGVALEENSRGGSQYIHENVNVGSTLQVGRITSDIKQSSSSAVNHALIIGGVGITAFLPLLEHIRSGSCSYQAHLAVRSSDEVPFRDRLDKFSDSLTLYDKSAGERMDIGGIVRELPPESYLWVCGPPRMMEAAKVAVEEHKLPWEQTHFEAFAADISGDPFEAEITNQGGRVIQVGDDESLLEALRREFKSFPSSCEVGNCATCKVTLKGGLVEHRGTALAPDEQHTSMLSCVSRGIGRIAIEI